MTYKFSLFLADKDSVKGREMIAYINEHLIKRFKDAFDLVIVDVIERPELASKEQIFVTPSWVRNSPGPKKKLIGNFCDKKNVSKGLDLFFQ